MEIDGTFTESSCVSQSSESESDDEQTIPPILKIHSQLRVNKRNMIDIRDIYPSRKYRQKVIRIPACPSTAILTRKILRLNFNNFSHAFMLCIQSEVDHSILILLSKKVDNERPLIVEFEWSNDSTIFYKTENTFLEFNRANRSDFQRNLNSLLDSIDNNFDQLTKHVVSRNDSLIIRFLKLFELSQEFSNALTLKLAKEGNVEKLMATMDVSFTYQWEFINPNLEDILVKIFSGNMSILKVAAKNNNLPIVDWLMSKFPQILDRFSYDHKMEIVNMTTNEDIIFMILTKANFPFPTRWMRPARCENGNHQRASPREPQAIQRLQGFRSRLSGSQETSSVFNENNDANRRPESSPPSHAEIEDLIKSRNEFHNAIADGNLKKIKTMEKEFASTKVVFNSNNESAVMTALKRNQFEIYSYLRSSCFIIDKRENDEHRVTREELDENKKEIITNFNLQHASENKVNPVLGLLRKSIVHMGGDKENDCHSMIGDMFNELYVNDELTKFLDIASKCQDLSYIFHFGHTSVDDVCPTESTSTNGLMDPKRKVIFIAAGHSLTSARAKQRTKGLIMHETLHYVFNKIFDNGCLPFDINDSDAFHRLSDIVIEHFNKWKFNDLNNENNIDDEEDDGCDEIIKSVYNMYSTELKGLRESEIIVRPAQILAHFDDDSGKIDMLKAKYKNLFDFFESLTVRVKQFNDTMTVHENARELNKIIGILPDIRDSPLKLAHVQDVPFEQDIVIIVSTVQSLTLVNVYMQLRRDFVDTKNIFLSTKTLRNEEIRDRVKKIFPDSSEILRSCPQPMEVDENVPTPRQDAVTLVIKYLGSNDKIFIEFLQECSPDKVVFIVRTEDRERLKTLLEQVETVQRSEIITHQRVGGKFSDVERKNDFLRKLSAKVITPIHHEFQHLAERSQQFLLDKFVEFQEHPQVQLKSLVRPENAKNVIDTAILNLLCEDEKIHINKTHRDVNKSQRCYHLRQIIRKSVIENTQTVSKIEFEMLKNNQRVKSSHAIDNEQFEVTELKQQTETISQETLVDGNSSYVLISDIAGNGKSWLLRHLSEKVAKKNPNRWIIFVSLKEIYEELKTISKNTQFTEFITKFVLKSPKTRNFELKLFIERYTTGHVSVFLDGIDEIYPDRFENVVIFVQSFQYNEGNQLWMTTRSHSNIEANLQKELKFSTIYSLKSLTDDEAIDILVDLLEAQEAERKGRGLTESFESISRDDKENQPTKISLPAKRKSDTVDYRSKAIDLFNRLKSIKEKSNIGIPQLLTIIVKYYNGDNTQKRSNLEFTNYALYMGLAEIHEEDWQKKFIQLRTSSRVSFLESHQYYAMQHYFAREEFCDLKSGSIWTKKQILEGGIADFINDRINFHHETFLEFFAADFVIRLMDKRFWENFDDFFEFFVAFLAKENYNVIRSFIDDKIKDFTATIGVKIDTFREKFVAKAKQHSDVSEIFKHTMMENCEHLFEFLLLMFDNEGIDQLSMYFSTIVRINIFKSYNIVVLSAQRCPSIFNKTINFLIEKFDGEDLKNFFIANKFFQELAVSHKNIEKVKETFALKASQKLTPQQLKEILRSNSVGGNDFLQMQIFEFDPILFDNIWKFLVDNLKDEFADFLFQRDKFGKSILHNVAAKGDAECLSKVYIKLNKCLSPEKMWEMLTMRANEIDKQRTFLHFTAFFKPLKFHKALWAVLGQSEHLIDILNMKDSDQNCFLHSLVSFASTDVIKEVFRVLREKLEPIGKFKDVLNVKGFNNRNLLQKCLDKNETVETHKLLWHIVQNSCESKAEFLEYLKYVDKMGDNVLHTTVAFSTDSVLKFVIDYIEKHFDESTVKDFLKIKNNKYKYNVLHTCALLNSSPSMHMELWEVLKKNLDPDDLKDLVRHCNSYGSHLLHTSVAFRELEIVKFTWAEIKKVLPEREDQKYYVAEKGFKRKTLYQNAMEKNTDNPNVADWVDKLIRGFGLLIW